jgi:hypothetical protein
MEMNRRTVLKLSAVPAGLMFAPSGLSSLLSAAHAAEQSTTVTAGDVQQAIQNLQHPFLIVDASAFTDWPARAGVPGSPEAGMLADAVNDSQMFWYTHRETGDTWEHLTPPGVPVVTTSEQMRSASLVNATVTTSALAAYIADPANRAEHLSVLERMLTHFAAYVGPYLGLGPNLEPGTVGGWEAHVTPASCFFNLVVALDIAHDDLVAAGSLGQYQDILADAADWFWSDAAAQSFNWISGLYGARAIWSLYAKEYTRAAQAINDYVAYQAASIEDDGVFLGGAYYANERFVPPQGKRDSKLHLMDVLEFLDLVSFYDDPRWVDFHEWVFGYSFSPVTRAAPDDGTAKKDYFIFGDTHINGRIWNQTYENDINGASADVYKAYRFSETAFAYAGATVGQPETPMGRLWHFAFYDRPFPDPVAIPSRVFPSGNAVFFEPSPDPGAANLALSSALWCPVESDSVGGHRRFDVNAIHLTAYGEHMLRGAGYPGFTPMMNDPEYWLHNQSHNTVMVDRVQHTLKHGNGFDDAQAGHSEAILGDELCYVSGHSGPALPNATHVRNLVQINGQDGVGGYWVLTDEIAGAAAGSDIQVMLHPASTEVVEVAVHAEYRSRANYRPALAGSDVDLTIFLGTTPAGVSLRQGKFGFIGQSPEDAQYLEAEYAADADGGRRIITVLYPHRPSVTKPVLTRTSGAGYTGAKLDFGGQIVDHSWESDGDAPIVVDGVTFHGVAGTYRLIDGELAFAFVRKGTQLRSPAATGPGFEATSPVSAYLDRERVRLVAPEDVDVWLFGSPAMVVRSLPRETPVRRVSREGVKIHVRRGSHEWTWSRSRGHTTMSGG